MDDDSALAVASAGFSSSFFFSARGSSGACWGAAAASGAFDVSNGLIGSGGSVGRCSSEETASVANSAAASASAVCAGNRFADRALGPLRWDVSGGHVLGLAGHHGTGRPTEQTLERVTDSVDQGGLRHGTRRLLSGHGHNGVSTSDGVAGTRRDGDDVLYCADSQNRGVLRITAGERNGIHQFGTDTGPKRRLRPFACPKARASGYGP